MYGNYQMANEKVDQRKNKTIKVIRYSLYVYVYTRINE